MPFLHTLCSTSGGQASLTANYTPWQIYQDISSRNVNHIPRIQRLHNPLQQVLHSTPRISRHFLPLVRMQFLLLGLLAVPSILTSSALFSFQMFLFYFILCNRIHLSCACSSWQTWHFSHLFVVSGTKTRNTTTSNCKIFGQGNGVAFTVQTYKNTLLRFGAQNPQLTERRMLNELSRSNSPLFPKQCR